MDLKNKLPAIPSQSQISNQTLKVFLKTARYFILLVLMILLAGHENINPPFGKSEIDFFDYDSRQIIEGRINYLLLSDTSKVPEKLGKRINLLVYEFYKIRNFKPAWTVNNSTNQNFEGLKDIIDTTEYYGFPENYFNEGSLSFLSDQLLAVKKNDTKFENRANLEIQATKSAFLVMIYLHMGIIVEDTSSAFVNYSTNLPVLLNLAIENNNLIESILSVQPKMYTYERLQMSIPQFLFVYQRILTHKTTILKEEIVSKALNYCNIVFDETDSIKSNEKLIKAFQKRYNLATTGNFDSITQNKLISELHYRYLQICLNLDRLRKIGSNDPNYLFVNIPEFKLHLIENNKEFETFNVIVGRTETPTPTISSKIERIIANPDWTVPTKIAQNEMLSKIRDDSSYLQRNGYIIVNRRAKPVNEQEINWTVTNPFGNEYYIRQNKSDNNALGKLKFVFPNSYSVYLHDTPSKRLFSNTNRTYSHGCIRLQNPEKLAQYLTDKCYDCDGDSINISVLIAKNKQQVLNLEEKMPIHIQYITTMGDGSGLIYFLSDVYKLDEEAINLLFPG